jgi:hypothetical protein
LIYQNVAENQDHFASGGKNGLASVFLPFIMAVCDRNFNPPLIRRHHSRRTDIMPLYTGKRIFFAALIATIGAVPALASTSNEVPSYQPYYYAPAEQDRMPVTEDTSSATVANAPSVEVYPMPSAPAAPVTPPPPQLIVQPQPVPVTVSAPAPVAAPVAITAPSIAAAAPAPTTVKNLNDELPASMKAPAPMPVPASAAPAAGADVISTSNTVAATQPAMAAPVFPSAPAPAQVAAAPMPAPAATAPVPSVPLPAATTVSSPAPHNFNPQAQEPVTVDQLPSYQYSPDYDVHRTWPTPIAHDKKAADATGGNYFLDTPSGIGVGLLVEGYHYQEPDAGGTSVNLNGMKYGLNVDLTTHFDRAFYGSAEIEYARGTSDYHGSGTSDNHLEQLWDARGIVGFDLATQTTPWGGALYTGLGYRQLYSNDQGLSTDGTNIFAGYRRENQMVYLPLGVKPRYAFGPDSRLEMLFEGDILLWGQQTSWLGDVGNGDPTLHNEQKSGYGIRTGFMWQSRNWAFGPYLTYWDIKDSRAKLFQSPNSSCGGTLCEGIEPANHTIEYGVQAKYHFNPL